jgi:hypothetical protein
MILRKLISFLIVNCSLLVFPLFADCNVKGVESDAPALCGHAVQGGLLYGETDWNTRSELAVKHGDVFVIGVPMEWEDLKLEFCKNDKCRSFTYKIEQRKYAMQKVKVADKFINYPPEVQKRIDSENDKIFNAREIMDVSFIGFMDWKYPFAKKYPMTGEYGSRRVFNGEPKSPHKGIDIAAPKGTKVRPIGPGRVALAFDAYLSGKTVIVSHGFYVFSIYAHLSEINVKTGDAVDMNSTIGKVGATGRASGAHLHLGLYHGQTALDPSLLF